MVQIAPQSRSTGKKWLKHPASAAPREGTAVGPTHRWGKPPVIAEKQLDSRQGTVDTLTSPWRFLLEFLLLLLLFLRAVPFYCEPRISVSLLFHTIVLPSQKH